MNAPNPDTFRQAAQVIRTGGLAKGKYYTPEGEHCTIGALNAAVGCSLIEEVRPEATYLADMIGSWAHEPYQRGINDAFLTVARWNDNRERTQDEVITLLEQAAEKLEADR